ncbi:unnamed protein product [Ectocarpus fasciculatus]
MSLPGDEIWRFQAGASSDDDIVYGVSADAEGSFFIAGKTTGSLDSTTLNAGGEDMAAGKLDGDGVLLWSWQVLCFPLDQFRSRQSRPRQSVGPSSSRCTHTHGSFTPDGVAACCAAVLGAGAVCSANQSRIGHIL